MKTLLIWLGLCAVLLYTSPPVSAACSCGTDCVWKLKCDCGCSLHDTAIAAAGESEAAVLLAGTVTKSRSRTKSSAPSVRLVPTVRVPVTRISPPLPDAPVYLPPVVTPAPVIVPRVVAAPRIVVTAPRVVTQVRQQTIAARKHRYRQHVASRCPPGGCPVNRTRAFTRTR